METVQQKAKALTPSFYMTVVSIIQSFALGFLVSIVGENFVLFLKRDAGSLICWLQVFAVFQVIVMTWHVNVQHSVMYTRVFGWTDSYIPFLFAVPEYLMIVFIKNTNVKWWFLATSFYVAMVFLAYVDMYRTNRKEPENTHVSKMLVAYRWFILTYLATGFFTFLCMGLYTPTLAWEQAGLVGLVNALFIVFAVLHDRLCWTKVISCESRVA